MKIVIRVFAVLVAIWLILLVVGFMLPGHYRVERSVIVDAPPARVFPLVADLRSWAKWGVWFERDPGMKIEYSPATTEVGAWSQWQSKSQGDGKMTISSFRAPEDFEYKMEFSDVGMVSQGSVLLAPVPGGTKVTMAMQGDLGRSPLYRWLGVFMDRMVGPDFVAGLANLKRLGEGAAK
ncbi:MAG TPA: SRPBCC family protein [Opitutaceae bacterium]